MAICAMGKDVTSLSLPMFIEVASDPDAPFHTQHLSLDVLLTYGDQASFEMFALAIQPAGLDDWEIQYLESVAKNRRYSGEAILDFVMVTAPDTPKLPTIAHSILRRTNNADLARYAYGLILAKSPDGDDLVRDVISEHGLSRQDIWLVVTLQIRSPLILEKLMSRLRDGSTENRSQAAWALGQLGADAATARSELLFVSTWDPDEKVREAADAALRQIDTAIAETTPAQ